MTSWLACQGDNNLDHLPALKLAPHYAEGWTAFVEGCMRHSSYAAVDHTGSLCHAQVTKLHHGLEEAINTNTQLLADSSARQVELKAKEDELAGLRVEILKVIKVGLATAAVQRSCPATASQALNPMQSQGPPVTWLSELLPAASTLEGRHRVNQC